MIDPASNKNIQNNFIIDKDTLENSKNSVLVVNLKGKILYANKNAVECYGYSMEELLSMKISDLGSSNESFHMDQQFERSEGKKINFQTLHHTKNGSNFPVEVSYIKIKYNSEILFLTVIKDITVRVKKEDTLRRLASIIENSEDAILTKDLKGIVTSWNKGAQNLYGYSKEEIIGKSISTIIPDESKEDIVSILDKVKNNIRINHYETVRMRKNGTKLPISISVSPIYNEDNKVIGASTIARDITKKIKSEQELKNKYEELSSIYEELAATEEELRTNYKELSKAKQQAEKAKIEAENANRAKSQFLANMSHEIRTPLNGIIGAIELLGLMNINEDEESYIEILKNSSKHLLGIVNNILDISQIESGNIDLCIKVFNFKNMIDVFVREVSFACEKKNIGFTYYMDSLIPYKMAGDELKLRQVLINLFNNSLKFTQSGRITFKIKLLSQINEKIILEFSIKDTGIGIKDEFKKEIFKKFSQQGISYSKDYSGTGLGLSISKELVKIMNGDIWFESTENLGSTFYFTSEFFLDFSESSNNSSSNFDENRKSSSKNMDKTILIVEDNDINMQIVRNMIKNLKYSYQCAYTGKQALKLLKNTSVDLILMDIQMPELNGLEATKIIRKNEIHTGNHVPIVAMTAYGMLGDREMCIGSGMDDYISKPFPLEKLKITIKKFLG
ncbi:PAS domain S-box protein [Clostridium sp. WLY-B-L2]|uniref:Stage 0 sporulation protein A homolog n=1 Tax=Clostridium aromativorans TaxID=2836848 RepID=A0ABS8N2D9_9CLOT|nr:PAS domain S-box protein [Clostridium aromativorans]MCC9293953.1 PAS domain S-box protein [Clostridium aromativorans]